MQPKPNCNKGPIIPIERDKREPSTSHAKLPSDKATTMDGSVEHNLEILPSKFPKTRWRWRRTTIQIVLCMIKTNQRLMNSRSKNKRFSPS